MRVPRWIVPLIALVALFGSVAVGQATGWWQTRGADLRTLAGATPEDIRGSSSLTAVSEAFGIPMDELLPLLSLPSDTDPGTQLKELEAYNEVSAVRALVAAHLGLPWDVAAESAAEQPPAPTPVASAPTAVTPDATAVTPEGTPGTPAPTTTHAPLAPPSESAEIRGSTTLQAISDLSGIPLEELYAALGLPANTLPSTPLRDLKEQVPGFEIETVRALVDEYLAR